MADTEGSLRATWVAAERRRHSMRWTSCAAPAHAFQVAPVTALVSASHVHAIEETGDQSQGRHKCKICKAVSAGAFGRGRRFAGGSAWLEGIIGGPRCQSKGPGEEQKQAPLRSTPIKNSPSSMQGVVTRCLDWPRLRATEPPLAF